MRRLAALATGLLVATITDASATEITVLSANGVKLIMEALVPRFERTTNNKVTIKYGEAGDLRKRILSGESFDLTILPAGWDEIREKIVGNPVGIGRTDVGMAVLATVPKPDTTSTEGLKRTLLLVKSIVYTDPKTGGISGVVFARAIEKMGITKEVNKKSNVVAGVPNATFVAKGEADLAVQLASEILAVPGVQFVPMPPEFRASITFSGAIGTTAKDPTAAKALIDFLIGPEGAPVIKSKGYEPG